MLKKVQFFPLLFISMLLVAVPAVQAAEPPQFRLSTSEGFAGSQVTVSQIDACPTTEHDHTSYVFVTFVDVGGAKYEGSTFVEKDGSWTSSVTLRIPHKVINRYDPAQTNPGAAIGVGSIEAYCSVPARPLKVAQRYQGQAFTVKGLAPNFALPSSPVFIEGTMRIRSMQSCPRGMTQVRVSLANTQVNIGFDVTASASGEWIADITVPKTVADPMFGDKPFPIGKSVISAECRSENEIQHYADEILEVKAKPVKYAALGDSYSSGVGTFKYYDSGNNCYRSELGYPPYVAKVLNLGEFTFAACSGAVTDDFFVANPKNANEPAQLSRLTADTEIVTLTIGGNDAGFAEVLRTCINSPQNAGWGCSKNQQLKDNIRRQLAGLSGDATTIGGRPVHAIADILEQIYRLAPKAKVYIAGYPKLFGEEREYYRKFDAAPGRATCFVPLVASVSYKDALWLNKQVEVLNRIIESQVKKANKKGARATYVSPLFSGHGLCDRSSPWLNGVIVDENKPLSPKIESFHPSVSGAVIGYGSIFEIMIKRG